MFNSMDTGWSHITFPSLQNLKQNQVNISLNPYQYFCLGGRDFHYHQGGSDEFQQDLGTNSQNHFQKLYKWCTQLITTINHVAKSSKPLIPQAAKHKIVFYLIFKSPRGYRNFVLFSYTEFGSRVASNEIIKMVSVLGREFLVFIHTQ